MQLKSISHQFLSTFSPFSLRFLSTFSPLSLHFLSTFCVKVSEDVSEELAVHRQNKDRLAFLRIAQSQRGYGFAAFRDVTTNYPAAGTVGTVLLGQGSLLFTRDKEEDVEYLIHRMRCWRTYSADEGVEMEFEYFFDNEKQVRGRGRKELCVRERGVMGRC